MPREGDLGHSTTRFVELTVEINLLINVSSNVLVVWSDLVYFLHYVFIQILQSLRKSFDHRRGEISYVEILALKKAGLALSPEFLIKNLPPFFFKNSVPRDQHFRRTCPVTLAIGHGVQEEDYISGLAHRGCHRNGFDPQVNFHIVPIIHVGEFAASFQLLNETVLDKFLVVITELRVSQSALVVVFPDIHEWQRQEESRFLSDTHRRGQDIVNNYRSDS
jgi:hypothetical protein